MDEDNEDGDSNDDNESGKVSYKKIPKTSAERKSECAKNYGENSYCLERRETIGQFFFLSKVLPESMQYGPPNDLSTPQSVRKASHFSFLLVHHNRAHAKYESLLETAVMGKALLMIQEYHSDSELLASCARRRCLCRRRYSFCCGFEIQEVGSR